MCLLNRRAIIYFRFVFRKALHTFFRQRTLRLYFFVLRFMRRRVVRSIPCRLSTNRHYIIILKYNITQTIGCQVFAHNVTYRCNTFFRQKIEVFFNDTRRIFVVVFNCFSVTAVPTVNRFANFSRKIGFFAIKFTRHCKFFVILLFFSNFSLGFLQQKKFKLFVHIAQKSR